ncbi:MAG: transcriptional regulator [Paludibacter sp.]|nr:transcriptional regulator [Paludibacter sp.]
MAESKNETGWIKLFEDHKIFESIQKQGSFIIDSKQINVEREARLMAKIDHSFQLPKIFADNNLSILPISRGEYIISDIKTFSDFTPCEDPIIDFVFPGYIESLDYNNITSEAVAINGAYVSGIIEDFTQDKLLLPTVNGRMSSQAFNFNIYRNPPKSDFLNIDVEKSQIEIDAGFEGLNSLNLLEAKNTISSDFIIRQLYYPYRLWESKISKPVRPMFLTYTNGIFHMREYVFDDLMNYNSIRLINQKRYRIKENTSLVINTETIQGLIHNSFITAEPEIPFPQADSFERIINLCEILCNKVSITKDELILEYDFKESDTFDMRQVDYYTNAARYLGFVEKGRNENNEICFYSSQSGKNLFDLSIKERQIEFSKTILSHLVFNRVLSVYFKQAEIPSKTQVVQIMKECNLHKIDSEVTFKRRASTILSWLNWILDLIEE